MPAHLIAEEGPDRGLILNLEEGVEWTIGRDPDACDLVVQDSTVSRKHARLNKTADGIYLKNLSRVNPCSINDEQPAESVRLKEGDRIQIGNTVFVYSEQPIASSETPRKNREKKKPTKGGYDDIFGDIEFDDIETPSEEPTRERDVSLSESEEPNIPPAPPKPEMTVYDTIFEDTGEEEDVLFNLIPESPLVLKVIAGPNAGAEIGIEKGKTYTIGKDPNSCEIVFQDLSVSRHHARLNVSSEGEIEIEDLGSKNGIAVNGSLLAEPKTITSQDLVALGTTVFMIVDREAPQETIYSPMVPAYEPPKNPVETPPVPEAAPEPPEEKNWKAEPIPIKYWVMGGSAAAVFLIMFLTFFSLFKSQGVETASKEPVSEIKEALAKFSGVQFSYNPASGKLFIVGHVLTTVEYEEMNYRLSQIDVISSVQDNVVIDEKVWKVMNDILSDNPAWRSVSIHSPAAGKFVASGYIATAAEAAQLSEYLTMNFPYTDKLDNQVIVEQILNTQLQSMIAGANAGTVTFQLSNGNVILSGMYNQEMESEYQKLVKTINQVKGVASVQNFAIAAHPSKAGIDISQQYQITGTSSYDGRGYSVVMNGKIYTLGDQVDGMKITSIETNTILLEKDGLKYKIDYTR